MYPHESHKYKHLQHSVKVICIVEKLQANSGKRAVLHVAQA